MHIEQRMQILLEPGRDAISFPAVMAALGARSRIAWPWLRHIWLTGARHAADRPKPAAARRQRNREIDDRHGRREPDV